MKTQFILCVILFFSFGINLNASHVISSDLTYKSLGGLNYELTLKVYRDCSGYNLLNKQEVVISSNSLSVSNKKQLKLDTFYDVSQVCGNMLSNTTCNSGSLPGTQVYIYKEIITLLGYSADWEFSFLICCRSNNIINILTPFPYFSKVTLNNSGGRFNNSVEFNSVPVMYTCINEPIHFNNNGIDSDGDSLSYSLTNTFMGNNLQIPYSSTSSSPSNPFSTLSGFRFDSLSGQISFTPISLGQYILTFLVTEFDSSGVIKGTYIRGIEFVILNCSNPQNIMVSGVDYDSVNYTKSVCYNSPFCFDVFSVSIDTLNPITLNCPNLLPSSSFVTYVKNDTVFGTFCGDSLINSNVLTIEATYNSCPLKKVNTFSYYIKVLNQTNKTLDTTVYLSSSGFKKIDSTFVLDINNTSVCKLQKVILSNSDFDCSNIGNNRVEITSMYTNQTKQSFATVTVLDTIKPIANCKSINVYLDSNDQASIDSSFVDNGSSDNCNIATIKLSKENFDCSDLDSNLVIMTVTDFSGNSSSVVFVVNVLDTIMPSIKSKDTTLYLDVHGNANVNSRLYESDDNCSMIPTTYSIINFTCLDTGKNKRIHSVSDLSGNTSSCKSIVTVLDTIKPTVICKNVFVYLGDSGSCTIDSNFMDNGSYDNCGIESIKLSKVYFDCSNVGQNTVRMTVKDKNGNINFCESIVTLVDTIKPVILCIDTVVYLGENGLFVLDSIEVINKLFDNCGIDSVRIGKLIFNCVDLGINWVSLIVKDVNGNVNSCQMKITILDTINMVADAGNDIVLCGAFSTVLGATQTDSYFNSKWLYLADTSILINNKKAFNTEVGNLKGGVSYLVWSVTDSMNCRLKLDTVSITVLTEPAVFAGQNAAYCGEDTIILNATKTAANENGFWSIDSSFSSTHPLILNPANSNTKVIGLTEGVYRFIWRVSSFPCYDVSDTVEITFNKKYLANAGADQSFCNQASTIISANSVSGNASAFWKIANHSNSVYLKDSSKNSTTINNLVKGNMVSVTWEIKNGICPVSRDTINIRNKISPIAEYVFDTNQVCVGNSINFSSLSSIDSVNEKIISEIWNVDGEIYKSNAVSHVFGKSGIYDISLVVSASNGCIDTVQNKVTIRVNPKPIAGFQIDKNEEEISVDLKSIMDRSFLNSYYFDFGDGDSSSQPNLTHVYRNRGVYDISQIVVNNFGCKDTTVESVEFEILLLNEDVNVFIPNSFTPNNDGRNDIFIPVSEGIDFSVYEFSIFNRWGNLIYNSTIPNMGWDGKFNGQISQVGEYIWTLTVKQNLSSKTELIRGTVSLIR